MKFIIITKYRIIVIIILIFALLFNIILNNVFSNNKYRLLPIYNVKTDKKQIAITFDSAWGDEDLAEILDILNKYDCKATFFVTGEFVDKFPGAIKNMYENNNEIGNHSDKHKHPNNLNKEEIIKEIENCDKKIKAITNQDKILFRAPYGEYNNLLVETCNTTNRYIIQWDVDSLDWKSLPADEIRNRVVNKTKNGSIILLHNGAKHTKEALPLLLCDLKNKGYEFVTVSNLIYKTNYYIDNTGMQIPK